MKVSVFGAGYVGLVTAACLAEMGNSVVCVDINETRVSALNQGEVPIHEPGLTELVIRNQQASRLSFTLDASAAVSHATIIFIAVGTPANEDGSADVEHVLAAARTIGQCMQDYKVVVNKNTVPVGTEWREFRSPDFAELRAVMKEPIVIDGRNLFDPVLMEEAGFEYVGVGRGKLLEYTARQAVWAGRALAAA